MVSERVGETEQSTTASGGQQESSDPQVLAAEIEATREDLAETLDAIADRVSPKRVAERGKERAKDVAAHAKEVVTEKALIAKDTLAEKAGAAREAASAKAATAKAAVQERTASHTDDWSVAITPTAAPTTATGDLPPVTAVEVPVLSPRPAPTGTPAWAGAASGVPKEALAGGVIALLALLLVLRRRRNG